MVGWCRWAGGGAGPIATAVCILAVRQQEAAIPLIVYIKVCQGIRTNAGTAYDNWPVGSLVCIVTAVTGKERTPTLQHNKQHNEVCSL